MKQKNAFLEYLADCLRKRGPIEGPIDDIAGRILTYSGVDLRWEEVTPDTFEAYWYNFLFWSEGAADNFVKSFPDIKYYNFTLRKLFGFKRKVRRCFEDRRKVKGTFYGQRIGIYEKLIEKVRGWKGEEEISLLMYELEQVLNRAYKSLRPYYKPHQKSHPKQLGEKAKEILSERLPGITFKSVYRDQTYPFRLMPDFLGEYKGRTVAIELKSGKAQWVKVIYQVLTYLEKYGKLILVAKDAEYFLRGEKSHEELVSFFNNSLEKAKKIKEEIDRRQTTIENYLKDKSTKLNVHEESILLAVMCSLFTERIGRILDDIKCCKWALDTMKRMGKESIVFAKGVSDELFEKYKDKKCVFIHEYSIPNI